jgi:hypothetical protein
MFLNRNITKDLPDTRTPPQERAFSAPHPSIGWLFSRHALDTTARTSPPLVVHHFGRLLSALAPAPLSRREKAG